MTPLRPASWLVTTLAAASTAFWLPAAPTTAPHPTTTPPGSVLRWPGEGLTRCGIAGVEAWDPLDGDCWYGFDLEKAPGTVVRVFRQRGAAREEAEVQLGAYPYETQHIRLKDDRHVNLSPADLARSKRESAEVGKLFALRGPARFRLPLAAPLAQLPQSGRFGDRRVFNGQPRSPHSGADYRAATGTPVLAVADGRVVLAADHFFSGKSVFVDHGDGLLSMYFHLSKLDVASGQEIRRGERLGAVGATGRATGPHLHFGLRWKGARVDPDLLLGSPEKVGRIGG
jgi:murein DD-endopeptidase MepM/ murein hydrolase activator NlpD